LNQPLLSVKNVSHQFGNIVALDKVSISAQKGEFLTLLGESGSGKTTLLRIIAGLETPTYVETITLSNEDITNHPPDKRNCTTVFQSYALFPHMSVFKNIEYGLKIRGFNESDRRTRVENVLELVRLEGFGNRKPGELSGGQKQRVALARAIVTEPAILLFDEPLGALDERLRLDMQVELKELHERLKVTFIYVTHSQEEALTMSDRIILMRQGKIEQEGLPHELFDRPKSSFTAKFMGAENIFEGKILSQQGKKCIVGINQNEINATWHGSQALKPGTSVFIAIRAERVNLNARDSDDNSFQGKISKTIYKGKYSDHYIQSKFGELKSRIWDKSTFEKSDICFSLNQKDVIVMRN
jgi:ABC-type Fe3+/spermidine/putrescine transport system ATPase subunit